MELEFDSESTCIIGKNASGKTSLLEAVAVLARLQSPRTNSLAQLVRHGAKGLVTDGYSEGYHLQFYYSTTRRKIALDGVEQKNASAYLDLTRLVYLANSDIALIRGPSEIRRRFLDFVAAQLFPGYRDVLKSYEKAVHLRNRYLKMIPSRPKEVSAYSKPLLQFGSNLTMMRADLLQRLGPHLAESFGSVSDRSEQLNLSYFPGATDDFEKALIDSADQEARLMVTIVGPHRDDFQLQVNGKPAEHFASEGQQRTIAIALRLAEAKVLEQQFKKPPLLLLDDVFGELDTDRRKRLFSALPSRGQRFITTTNLDWLCSLPIGKVYRIGEHESGGRRLDVLQ